LPKGSRPTIWLSNSDYSDDYLKPIGYEHPRG